MSIIWVLLDGRAGNRSQVIGLADKINKDYKIIDISYSIFAKLPNFILGNSLLVLDKKSRQKITNIAQFPDLVIGAGRRCASIALNIKKRSKGKTKIAQIMNPEAFHDKFDFIILPKHDEIKSGLTNLIRTNGALTKTNASLIKKECEKFHNSTNLIQKPKIALLIGGDSKKTKFDDQSAHNLIKKSIKIAKNMDAQLFILTSRRTSQKTCEILQENLRNSQIDFKFFDYNAPKKEQNPYLAILGLSDYFIVTADSVSMISESCSMSKPVYIYDAKNISTSKHKKFYKALLLENYVQKLNENTKILQNFGAKKLDETAMAASIIKEKLN